MKSQQGFYKPGDHYIQCDLSGFKVRRSDARMMWDGKLVHKDFWEQRQPQDFVRGRADKIAVDQPRPEGDNEFIGTNDVQPEDL